MRLHVDSIGGVIHIALSRRNLAAMLHKLDYFPDSALRIESDPECFGGWQLVFTGETDQDHYGDRPLPPGLMHPWTEYHLNSPYVVGEETPPDTPPTGDDGSSSDSTTDGS